MVRIGLEFNRKRLQQILKDEEENFKMKQKIRKETYKLKRDFKKKWLSG